LQFLGVGIFFENFFAQQAVLLIDFGVELVKGQGVVGHPLVMLAEDVEISRHRLGGIVAFGHGNAQEP
jgi:hypothetical protein